MSKKNQRIATIVGTVIVVLVILAMLFALFTNGL